MRKIELLLLALEEHIELALHRKDYGHIIKVYRIIHSLDFKMFGVIAKIMNTQKFGKIYTR